VRCTPSLVYSSWCALAKFGAGGELHQEGRALARDRLDPDPTADQSPPFTIDVDSIVEGMGSVALRQDCIDLSMELSKPLFWGNFSSLHMVSEDNGNPYKEFLGLSEDDVDSYYTSFLAPLFASTTWPIFPLEIDRDRYVEIEWAAAPNIKTGSGSVQGFRNVRLFWAIQAVTSLFPA
jgi:hypothetical protein